MFSPVGRAAAGGSWVENGRDPGKVPGWEGGLLGLGQLGLEPGGFFRLAQGIVGRRQVGPGGSQEAHRRVGLPDQNVVPRLAFGRGLGEPLYRTLLDVLRAQGFHAAIGGIALPNPASVRLHERLGFVACGTVQRAGRKFDAWHDVGFWQLFLHDERHAPGELLAAEAAFAAVSSR